MPADSPVAGRCSLHSGSNDDVEVHGQDRSPSDPETRKAQQAAETHHMNDSGMVGRGEGVGGCPVAAQWLETQ